MKRFKVLLPVVASFMLLILSFIIFSNINFKTTYIKNIPLLSILIFVLTINIVYTIIRLQEFYNSSNFIHNIKRYLKNNKEFNMTRIIKKEGKGRCVIATQDIPKDTEIIRNEIIKISYNKIKDSELDNYSMAWDDNFDCIALGHINLLNHSSSNNNITIYRDYTNERIIATAKKDIKKGEELLICYECPLWFEEV